MEELVKGEGKEARKDMQWWVRSCKQGGLILSRCKVWCKVEVFYYYYYVCFL